MMPELLVLVKGILAATRSVLTVMVLLLVCRFTFAIVFKQMTVRTESGSLYFSSVGESMFSLLPYGVSRDSLSTMADSVQQDCMFCLVLFIAFVLLTALTILNMLFGVLCEVVINSPWRRFQLLQLNPRPRG